MAPLIPQKNITPILNMMIVQSMAFLVNVSAHVLRWNMAGNVKAMGVQNNAPVRPRNEPTFVSRIIVKTTVKRTRRNLVKFFVHYLFLVLGHDE